MVESNKSLPGSKKQPIDCRGPVPAAADFLLETGRKEEEALQHSFRGLSALGNPDLGRMQHSITPAFVKGSFTGREITDLDLHAAGGCPSRAREESPSLSQMCLRDT
jgi:hypothetical protein